MPQIKIKPVGSARVLDPQTKQPLKKSGEMVELTTYWRRRIAAGEVEMMTDKKGK